MLGQHVEEAQQERRELLKAMQLLQEEKQQLQEEQRRLAREREQERETCCLLRTHNQVRATADAKWRYCKTTIAIRLLVKSALIVILV